MNYYHQIKSTLIKNEAYKVAKDYSKNRSDLRAYYEVGKLLIEAQGGEARAEYGNRLIKDYSTRLTRELGPGYSTESLKRMRRFYLFASRKGSTVWTQLPWSHYRLLMSLGDDDRIRYYIDSATRHNWSYRELYQHIKDKDYERLPADTRDKLSQNKPIMLQDTVKDPVIIRNSEKCDEFSEKVLRQLILDDMEHFLKELGNGFTFIGSEYKIKIGSDYHHIDLLLYNIEFNSYVVVELKITEFKAEYIGQIQKYMNYIDTNLKTLFQDDTIGIIIARRKNKFVLEYCSDPRVKVVEWILG